MCSEAPQFQRAKCSSVASWISHHLSTFLVPVPPKKTLAGFPSLFMSWWSRRIVTFWMSYTKRHGKSAGAGWAAGGWCFLSRFFVGETKASQLGKHFFFSKQKQLRGRWIRWRVAIPPLRSGVVVMGNGDTRSMLRFKEWLQRNRFLDMVSFFLFRLNWGTSWFLCI